MKANINQKGHILWKASKISAHYWHSFPCFTFSMYLLNDFERCIHSAFGRLQRKRHTPYSLVEFRPYLSLKRHATYNSRWKLSWHNLLYILQNIKNSIEGEMNSLWNHKYLISQEQSIIDNTVLKQKMPAL